MQRPLTFVFFVIVFLAFGSLAQVQAASPVWTNVGGALFVTPTPGIGLVADLPWSLRGAAGLTTNGADASTAPSLLLQVQRNWHLKLPWLGTFPTEFAGVRVVGHNAGVVVGLGAPIHLYPDLHVDLALELLAGGGSSSGAALAVQAVQDF